MVCLRNICINTLHKGHNDDDGDNDDDYYYYYYYYYYDNNNNNNKVYFTLEQASKAQRGSYSSTLF